MTSPAPRIYTRKQPGEHAKAVFTADVLDVLWCFMRTRNSSASSPWQTENIYADVLDAYGAFSTIDSGLMKSYDGKDRQAWEKIYREKREALVAHLSKLPPRRTFQERCPRRQPSCAPLSLISRKMLRRSLPAASARMRKIRTLGTTRCVPPCIRASTNSATSCNLRARPSTGYPPSACLSRSRSRNDVKSCFLRSILSGKL